MRAWSEFHDDPRISYYRYLRRDYRLPAHEAHCKVKRTDAMVVGLQRERDEARAGSTLGWGWAAAWKRLRNYVTPHGLAGRSLKPH